MPRISLWTAAFGLAVLMMPTDNFARGGRGGGGGGRSFGGGGGGMARPMPAPGRSPSPGGARPSYSAPRPAPRPSTPSVAPRPATPRPGTGNVARPGTGVGTPGVGRPGVGTPGVGRPGGPGPSVGARPGPGGVNDFIDVGRPATGAGGAAGRFLEGGTTKPGGPQIGGGPADVPGRPGVGAPGVGVPGVGVPGVGVPGVGRPGGPGIGGPGVATRPVTPRQALANNRPDRIENRGERQGQRQERRDEVRDQVRENHPRFDFWMDHPNWARWRLNRPYRWATWAALTGWVGYGWSEPVSYDYGSDVYYSEGQVYSGEGGEPIATAEEYAQQAADIAASAPEIKPEDAEWLSLGVFALTQDGQASGADPSLFLQLAVSKQGVIAGTFKNTTTGQVQQIEGMADKKSQRAAWGVVGQERPILETGIAGLTQDTSPCLIHFADGSTQQWLLVRLEEPKEPAAPAPVPGK